MALGTSYLRPRWLSDDGTATHAGGGLERSKGCVSWSNQAASGSLGASRARGDAFSGIAGRLRWQACVEVWMEKLQNVVVGRKVCFPTFFVVK